MNEIISCYIPWDCAWRPVDALIRLSPYIAWSAFMFWWGFKSGSRKRKARRG